VLALELLVDLDGQAFLGEVVHDRQGAEPAPIEQGVSDEVHAPDLVGCRQHGALQAMGRGLAPTGPLTPQVESGLAIQPVCALVVDLPPFPPQQYEDPAEAIADPCGGNLLDPPKQWPIIVLPGCQTTPSFTH